MHLYQLCPFKPTGQEAILVERLNQSIETLVKSCLTCQAVKSAPASVLLHPWVWPNAPWRRIHIEFAESFLGKMFIIIVDAFYHFTDYHRNIADAFSCYGIPE